MARTKKVVTVTDTNHEQINDLLKRSDALMRDIQAFEWYNEKGNLLIESDIYKNFKKSLQSIQYEQEVIGNEYNEGKPKRA